MKKTSAKSKIRPVAKINDQQHDSFNINSIQTIDEYKQVVSLLLKERDELKSKYEQFISDEKKSIDYSEKLKQKSEHERRQSFEIFLAEILVDFIKLKKEDSDLFINRVLSDVGTFAKADRSWVLLISDDGKFCSNTHEWCREGILLQIHNLQNVPLDKFPWWMDRLKRFETIQIPLVSELLASSGSEKEIFQSFGVQSLLVVPLVSKNKLIGFMGFDSVRKKKVWTKEDIALINTLGLILGNGFERIKLEEEIVRSNIQLENEIKLSISNQKKLFELNRIIIDNANLAIFSTDKDDLITSFNPFAEKILGYSAAEVIGKHTPEIFHLADQVRARFQLNNQLTDYTGFNFRLMLYHALSNFPETNEWIYVEKNGRRLKVLLSVNQLADENGVTVGYVTIALDITQRKTDEEKLKKSEQENKAIISAVPDLLFSIDREGTFLNVHDPADSSLFYGNIGQLPGKSLEQVLPPDVAQESLILLEKAFLTGKVVEFAYKLSINGEDRFFENRIVSISDKSAISIVRDFTASKRAEEALKETTIRLKTLIENLRSGILFEDENRKITLANRSFCEIFQLEFNLKNLYGADYQKALTGLSGLVNDPNLFKSQIKKIIRKKSVIIGEEIEFLNGSTYERDYIPIDEQNQSIGHLWVYRDITARKELESRLIESLEKEKELNELKSRFISTTSHEFRTPLASILLLSDTLIAYQSQMDLPQINSKLERIKDHVFHLTDIVNDVLQLSKLQESKIGFNFVETELVEWLSRLIDNFLLKVNPNRIRFFTDFKKVAIKLDLRIVTQAMNNLISNAIKYSSEQDEVVVEIKDTEFELVISVSDSGIGIPEEDQKHLFTPFFRAGNVSAISGNGLGLSIVRESMQNHGGRVTFVSNPSGGSTFLLHFPKSLVVDNEK